MLKLLGTFSKNLVIRSNFNKVYSFFFYTNKFMTKHMINYKKNGSNKVQFPLNYLNLEESCNICKDQSSSTTLPVEHRGSKYYIIVKSIKLLLRL